MNKILKALTALLIMLGMIWKDWILVILAGMFIGSVISDIINEYKEGGKPQ